MNTITKSTTAILLIIAMTATPIVTMSQSLNPETDQIALAQSNSFSGISKNTLISQAKAYITKYKTRISGLQSAIKADKEAFEGQSIPSSCSSKIDFLENRMEKTVNKF